MSVTRYVVIVVERALGTPSRTGERYDNKEEAEQVAAFWNSIPLYSAFVVTLDSNGHDVPRLPRKGEDDTEDQN